MVLALSDANWIALLGVLATIGIAGVGGVAWVGTRVWKLAALLSELVSTSKENTATLKDHTRRLEVLETAQIDGREAARRLRQTQDNERREEENGNGHDR